MQIFSANLELRLLRTLTENSKVTRKLAGQLNAECFHSRVAKDVYSRLNTIAQSRNIVLSWDELLDDTVLKQSVRKVLSSFKKKPYDDKEIIKRKVKQLHDFRRLRAIYFAAEYATEALNQENADPDTIMTKMLDKLSNAKEQSNDSSNMVHIGGKDKSAERVLKNVLNPPKDKYIPIGIKAFQKYNPGLPRGAYVLIASESGGGKSVLANQIAANMALQGARVCLIQLEMDKVETSQRQVARFSDITMNKIVNAKNLQYEEIQKIKKSWKKLNAKIKERGGLFTIYTPDEDLNERQITDRLEIFKYDVKIWDYVGLLAGTDGDDQVKALSRTGRFFKVNAKNTNTINIACAQLSEDGKVRYARALNEHAQVAFTWQADAKARETGIFPFKMPKSRNLKPVNFYMRGRFDLMRFEDMDENEVKEYQNQQDSGKSNDKKWHKDSNRRRGGFQRKEAESKDYYVED